MTIKHADPIPPTITPLSHPAEWRPIADLIRVDGVARWAWLIPQAEQRALTGAGLRSHRAPDGTVQLMMRAVEVVKS